MPRNLTINLSPSIAHWIKNPLQKTSEHKNNYLNFLKISGIIPFLLTSNLFLNKTGYSLRDLDMIIPIKSSKFTKLLNFGSILKKTEKKTLLF